MVIKVNKINLDFNKVKRDLILKKKIALTKAAIRVQTTAKLLAPKNDGQLADSIEREVRTNYAKVGTNEDYAPWVEYGTNPHWPPLDPIKTWAKKVLGDERLGFVVAKKIAKKGTSPQPFLRPAFDKSKSYIKHLFAKIVYSL